MRFRRDDFCGEARECRWQGGVDGMGDGLVEEEEKEEEQGRLAGLIECSDP